MPGHDTATSAAAGSAGDDTKSQLEADSAERTGTAANTGQRVAEAKGGSLAGVVPAAADSPKGQVTLGEKAGAFGPWRAHQVINGTAQKIAEQLPVLLASTTNPRVLVVDDRSLLPGNWTARHVMSTLTRLSGHLKLLTTDISRGLDDFDQAILACEQPGAAAPPAGEGRQNRRRGGGPAEGEATATEAGAAPSEAASGGAWGAAVGLLGFLRTDYTITATTVSAAPSELATLTAGYLAAQPLVRQAGADGAPPRTVQVEADGFAAITSSPSSDLFAGVLRERDAAVQALSGGQARLAPVQAELDSINGRITLVEQAWTSAVTAGKDQTATDPLRSAVDRLVEQAARRENAAGPLGVLLTAAQQVVADVDAAVAALLQAPAGGQAPLLTAVRRERLDKAVESEKITHVLYVNLDALAADAVTRRSLVGTSGRIRFLSAGNASWLLLDTSTNTIAGGGQISLADAMTFSLENDTAQFKPAGQWLTASDLTNGDPLDKLETWAKVLIAVLILVLVAAGVLSFLAVIKVAVR